MAATNITLVTSFLNYYCLPLEQSTIDLRLEKITVLLKMEIPMVIYVSPDLIHVLNHHISVHISPSQTHIKLIPLAKHIFESSYAFLIAKNLHLLKLPKDRLPPKDTIEYMCYLHSKIGFLQQVCLLNPFRSNHFAWIDFDISTMWKRENVAKNVRFLKHLSKHGLKRVTQLPPTEHSPSLPLSSTNELFIPSIWGKAVRPIEDYCSKVCWRFCTNFFIGTSLSIQHLYYLYTEWYEVFLKKHNTMVWDMNFFAYLEQEKGWSPITYPANHDDSMITNFPLFCRAEIFRSGFCSAEILCENGTTTCRPFEFVRNGAFIPSSPSYIEFGNKRILNVRYVNYEYLPSGHCTRSRYICSLNKTVLLRDDLLTMMEDGNVIAVKEDAETMGLPEPDSRETFQGIEDIRLYNYMNSLKFIATTVNFSGCGGNRMVVGDYCLQEGGCYALKNAKVIFSPNKEKNWIPFVPLREPYRNYFVYSWSPFQLGEVNIESGGLDIVLSFDTKFPFIEDIRGSSNIVYDNGEYVALVHVSVEGTLPKQYYHMLVWLDENTYRPKSMSRLFCFEQYGIEFCLSMCIQSDQYVFFYSSQDRDPKTMWVDKKQLDSKRFEV